MSRNEKILAIAFAVMSICGILFTPAGLETRPLSSLRSYALIPLFLAGTILDFASLILIFKKPRIATITGIVAAIEYVFLAPGDQAQFFFVGVPVPVGITINEIVALIASIVVLLFAPMAYLANRKSLTFRHNLSTSSWNIRASRRLGFMNRPGVSSAVDA